MIPCRTCEKASKKLQFSDLLWYFGLVFTLLFEVLLLCTLLGVCIPSLLERALSLDSRCLLCYLFRVAKRVLSTALVTQLKQRENQIHKTEGSTKKVKAVFSPWFQQCKFTDTALIALWNSKKSLSHCPHQPCWFVYIYSIFALRYLRLGSKCIFNVVL